MHSNEQPVIDPGVFSIFGESAAQVFGIFLSENNESFHNLEEAMGSQDLQSVKMYAHKMAGSARIVRAERLAKIASALELAAEDNQIELQSLFDELAIAYSEVSSLIIDLRKGTEAEA